MGNHDVGANALSGAWPTLSVNDQEGWKSGTINFQTYFPMHSDASGGVPAPDQRVPYHVHTGGNMGLVVLDSGHFCRTPESCVKDNDQVEWLDTALANLPPAAAFKLACYHVPLCASHNDASRLFVPRPFASPERF